MATIQQLLDAIAGDRGITKALVNENPPVTDAGNRTQPRDEGGRFVSSDYSEPAEGQPYSASRDNWTGNADTEASRTHGPGSLGQRLIDQLRAQRNASQFPAHTLAGMVKETAIRRQVTVYGGSTDTSETFTGPATLVGDDDDDNPQVFQAFQAGVNRMAAAFRASTGRNPTFGASSDPDDIEFARAYASLREQYWPSGRTDDSLPHGQGHIQ